jgi:hypothetical protein
MISLVTLSRRKSAIEKSLEESDIAASTRLLIVFLSLIFSTVKRALASVDRRV